MSDLNPVYRTSPAAVDRRRKLVRAFQGLALLCGILALLAQAWLVAALSLALPALLRPRSWLERYAGRELRLQLQALEERTGGFTRFMLYEDMMQLRMLQGPGEKVLGLEIRGPKGGFLLKNYENMEAVFAELARRKPGTVIVEVEPVKFVF